jgi:hypothetical protein
VTLVFAMIERGALNRRGVVVNAWTPDDLPELPQRGQVKLGDAIGSAVFLLTMIGLVLWQQFAPTVLAADGTPLPLLNQGLWSLWLPVLFGLAVLEVGFAVLVWRVGRWTVPLAIVNTLLAVATAAILIWLFSTNQVVDPDWAARLRLTDLVAPGGVLAVVGAFVAAGIAVWDIVDGFLKTWRQREV